jgi:divalent metal cation (Fe/Co/Zn/Cd) transporter
LRPPAYLVILAVSVGIKIYMAIYNRVYGKKISSEAMLATSADARNDVLATTAVLIATLFAKTAIWVDEPAACLSAFSSYTPELNNLGNDRHNTRKTAGKAVYR